MFLSHRTPELPTPEQALRGRQNEESDPREENRDQDSPDGMERRRVHESQPLLQPVRGAPRHEG